MTKLDFTGRVAIVTGAGRGIGRSHALLLAERGCAVVVNDLGSALDGGGRDSAPADAVVGEIRAAGGRAIASAHSVVDEAEAVVAAALSAFGRLDILVNNAGFQIKQPFGQSTMAAFRSQFDVHVFGTVAVTRAAWPHLVACGAGRVVNTISSTIYGMADRAAYGAAKGAILAFTRCIAIDGEAAGIKVNCIAPTAGTRMATTAFRDFMVRTMPPELVAPIVPFLAHESCPVTGESFLIGGGKVARIAITENEGVSADPLTPESIGDSLSAILDETSARCIDRVHVPQAAFDVAS